jgi:hypothetical protein
MSARPPTAHELLAAIRAEGGRVYRSREPGAVFTLTSDPLLATRLQRIGGHSHGTSKGDTTPPGGYPRAQNGPVEWDIVLNAIETSGDETIWEAANGA